MRSCPLCGQRPAAKALGYCGPCLRDRPELARQAAEPAHQKSRRPLPSRPPRSEEGVTCRDCGNACRLVPGEVGFCGLRASREGKLVRLAGDARRGLATWYHDPLPTNCVANWVCPAGSESGYPNFSYAPGPEHGYYNLAVFLGGCSFDCLFCQNRSYHRMALDLSPLVAPEEVARAVRPDTACICYFGGDPSPQMAFALEAARLTRRAENRILRICWETNGNLSRRFLREMADISLHSGGCVKFDLKAYDDDLHQALTGVSNRRTLENFATLAEYTERRPDPPFLVASTLLVPGYVDAAEVGAIARFIARLNPEIPYCLLAFFPQHLMTDLPTTSKVDAQACLEEALSAGLKRVRLGNVHLLR